MTDKNEWYWSEYTKEEFQEDATKQMMSEDYITRYKSNEDTGIVQVAIYPHKKPQNFLERLQYEDVRNNKPPLHSVSDYVGTSIGKVIGHMLRITFSVLVVVAVLKVTGTL